MSRTALDSGTLHIHVDPGVCIGSGNCLIWAAATFALDGQHLVCLRDEVGDPVGQVLEAARSCPSGAITVVSPDGSYPS